MGKLTKFQEIVERLMTEEERNELGTKLKLNTEVMDFIHQQFEQALEHVDNESDMCEDDVARGMGRLGLYMSHQDVRDDLCAILFEAADVATLRPSELKRLDKVFGSFFEE